MEYYLCRAMEVCRLSEEQLSSLHLHESSERVVKDFNPKLGTFASVEYKSSRCLMPYEIQSKFKLPLLKEVYLIPENDNAQSSHNQRLRNEFRSLELIPKGGDLSTLDVERVHSFDKSIREFNNQMKIDLVYRGGRERKRMSDEL